MGQGRPTLVSDLLGAGLSASVSVEEWAEEARECAAFLVEALDGELAGIAAVERPHAHEQDLYGNPMWGDLNRVDELAAGASALMGQSDAGRPVVLICGAAYTTDEHATIRDLLVPEPTAAFHLAQHA